MVFEVCKFKYKYIHHIILFIYTYQCGGEKEFGRNTQGRDSQQICDFPNLKYSKRRGYALNITKKWDIVA